MTDGFTVLMFVLVLAMFLILTYSSGALDGPLKGKRRYESRKLEHPTIIDGAIQGQEDAILSPV